MNQQQREGEFLLQSGTIDTRDASPKQSLTVTFQVSREPAPLHRATATDMAHQGKSQRRRRAGWAGIKDRSPLGQTSWWFTDDRRQSGHLQGRGSDSDATLSRCNSDSTHGVGGGGNGGKDFNCRGHGQGRDQRFSSRENARSRKRDWFKELFAARNLATVVYGVSYTTSQSALPFMANRLVNPQESTGPGDPGSEGVREAWRGMAYGLVMSGYFITKMMSAPWIGYLSDKVGRRQALVVTLTGVGLSFLATKIWGQFSIQGLILCRLLMGCFAANGALIHAYIKDTVSAVLCALFSFTRIAYALYGFRRVLSGWGYVTHLQHANRGATLCSKHGGIHPGHVGYVPNIRVYQMMNEKRYELGQPTVSG